MALQNTDILKEIFKHLSHELDENVESSTARRTLLNAALSCETFYEPAMAAMWRVLSSIVPLLKLLPSFMQMNGRHILKEVSKADWAKFEKRARHVQVLLLAKDHHNISPFTYDRLRQLQSSCLLPALLKIRILDDFDASTSLCPFISLSPSIRYLELCEDSVENQEFFQSFIASVTTQAPSVTHLKLCSKGAAVDLCPLLNLLLLQDLDLEVNQGRLSKLLMTGLGRLKALKCLALRMGPQVSTITFPDSVPLPLTVSNYQAFWNSTRSLKLFAQLESLTLSGHPDVIMTSMAYISSPSLKILDINESNVTRTIRSRNWALRDFIRGVGQLQIFKMKQTSPAQSTIKILNILPLGRNLETVELREGSASIKNSDMLDIAGRFINLRILILPDSCKELSLGLEILLAPHTIPPRLECLKLCVFEGSCQLIPLPTLPTKPITRANAHFSLRQLSLSSCYGTLSDESTIQLSTLIHSAFPMLDGVEGYGPNAGKECWGRVNLFRAALRGVCENLEEELHLDKTNA
ncbi:hypothetical protein CPB83DRAFT_833832 [Crepidotus variabilis]|uniref:Uncharacterized protein n=1 Tax=Crepidotus variabilis TaxID=179855 RepID=A0A9P6ELV3_9AGAR|nr:hypothetical protein CPB83DRAFT_833832 [Crepidotus variabilis]